MRLRRGKRAGVSEIIGSLVLIAITLTAGAAVFGFVNGQAANSNQAVGAKAATNINFLNEKEPVVLAEMTSANAATVYVYNDGSIDPLSIASVIVTNTATPPGVCTINYKPFPTVNETAVGSISVDLLACTWSGQSFPFVSGGTYTFQVVGQFDSSAQLTVQF